jgi:transposase
MTERRHIKGLDRYNTPFMPLSLDGYIASDNPVRAIDAYVESLDISAFEQPDTGGPGRPSYPVRALIKLYIYGHMNKIHSSRKLEAECQRNLELIWLMSGLKPTYKTIADFRTKHKKALIGVNADFVECCKELNLYGGELAGIDGSFFEGNASKQSIHTKERIKKRLTRLEKALEKYMEDLDSNDQSEENAQLSELKEKQQICQNQLAQLEETGETQLSLTDPDARLLNKYGNTTAGYNVQIAVDAEHKLLICADVVNDGNDKNQLAPMATLAKDTLGVDEIDVAADGGYFKQMAIKECEDAKITPYVAIPNQTTPTRNDNRIPSEEFEYHEFHDAYHCPGGQFVEPTGRKKQRKDGSYEIHYASDPVACASCPLKEQCLPEKTPYRQIFRWEHKDVIDRHKARMEADGGEHMRLRSGLAEHPFGTLKRWCGWDHFLLRGLEKVRVELSLWMLSYNFKRVLSILGVSAFKAFCEARAQAKREEKAHFIVSFMRVPCFYLTLMCVIRLIVCNQENLQTPGFSAT